MISSPTKTRHERIGGNYRAFSDMPPCEATLTADTEDELVVKAQDHAQTVHGETISREEILKFVN